MAMLTGIEPVTSRVTVWYASLLHHSTICGADADRTRYILLARQVLYQLSYNPILALRLASRAWILSSFLLTSSTLSGS